MYLHNDCAHYDDCDYLNDVGSCPRVCGQYHHKDDVRVVRCKDCRFKTEPGQPNILCYNMKDDDFCSYGERKNNE